MNRDNYEFLTFMEHGGNIVIPGELISPVLQHQKDAKKECESLNISTCECVSKSLLKTSPAFIHDYFSMQRKLPVEIVLLLS